MLVTVAGALAVPAISLGQTPFASPDRENGVASPPPSPSTIPGGGQSQSTQAKNDSGTVTGRVIDQSGAVISGADVKLTQEGQTEQDTYSDENGRYFFANVQPGAFQLTITSTALTSQVIQGKLLPEENHAVPDVTLAVATQVTEVRVGLTPTEIAEVQVEEQEKQRVFGVIPNFFVSYTPNAAPLTPKLKFRLAWKSSVDPVTFAAIGALAGVEQATNHWHEYGQGAQGYAKRYGATYGDVAIGTFLGGAVLPTLLKQDPRYFYQGTGSKRSRLLHALSSSFICKSDSGYWEPNYSNIGGNFAAGGLSTLYHPSGSRSAASEAVSTALFRLAETTVANVFQEFVVPKLTPGLSKRGTARR